MKFIIVVLMALMFTGCAGSNKYGECIGFGKKEDPNLEYEISTRNVIVGAVFSGSLIVPIVTALEYAKCPSGPRR